MDSDTEMEPETTEIETPGAAPPAAFDVSALPANVKMFRQTAAGLQSRNFPNAMNAEDDSAENMITKALREGWTLERPV